MTSDLLPLDLFVSAQTRLAAREGISMIVRHKGDAINGTIVLKINLLNGEAHLYAQIRYGDSLVWSPLGKKDPMPDSDAETLISAQERLDPDLWVIEVEDQKGRLWFPGDIVKF